MPRLSFLAVVLVLAACAGGPAPAPAPAAPSAGTGPASGQWQLIIEVDDLPGAGKVPPQTMSLCSTPEDKKQWQDMVGGKAMAGCTVRDYRMAGPTISYTMQCGGGIEGSTVITVQDENTYSGESTMRLQAGDKPAVIRSRVKATRLAPVCKK